MSATRLVLGLSLLAGCGRRGFDDLPPSDALDGDANAPGDVAPNTARAVAAGRAHSCAILDGRLSCWGENAAGQLGLGDTTERPVPTRVEPTALWVTVATGASHTCAIRDDGTLWCWGDNTMGQLGIGAPMSTAVVTQVALPGPVRSVASKFESTCAILIDGTLWCWGVNTEGQLGQNSASVPIRTPVVVGNSSTWSHVAVGQGHTIAIEGGGASGTGRNVFSELGLGVGAVLQLQTMIQIDAGPWRMLSAGQNGSLGVRMDDTLWGWGANNAHTLGFATTTQRDLPELVDNTELWLYAEIDTFNGCGLVAPGAMRCWGRNVEGQLGRGDNIDALTPAPSGAFTDWQGLAVARFHTCAQRADGTVWCTGNNGAGELGVNDHTRRNAWTQVTLP